MNKPLSETDPDLFDIMEHEKVRKYSVHEDCGVFGLLLEKKKKNRRRIHRVRVSCRNRKR